MAAAANAGDPLGVTLVEPPSDLYEPYLDDAHRGGRHFGNVFGVNPGISYYDDGAQPNALAIPTAILPVPADIDDLGPLAEFLLRWDGIILLGVNLFKQEMVLQGAGPNLPLAAIVAHEFGHIMQYKAGMSPEGPWQMELHADFMAGWYLGRVRFLAEGGFITSEAPESLKVSVKKFFEIGDYAFNDPLHHGTPEERSRMVQTGYWKAWKGNLGAKQAFEEGKKLADLS
jgi:hypothetical protein